MKIICGRAGKTGGEPAGRAFTLIEMLVAVALFSMLIVIFGWVLVQAQRLVKRTIAVMRADTAINTIERVIRRDLGNLYQPGPLYIANRSISGTNYQVLLFTRAGTLATSTTVTGVNSENVNMNQAMAAVCVYSIVPVTGSLSGEKILFRASWLLNHSPLLASGTNTGVGAALDSYPQYISEVTSTSATGLLASGGLIYDLLNSANYVPTDLPLPIQTLSQMQAVWKYLATGGGGFTVEWTDGTLNGSNNELVWKSLSSTGLTSILWCKGTNTNTDTTTGLAGTYKFPTALRITFSLTGDEVKALGDNGLSFTIVVSMNRKGA